MYHYVRNTDVTPFPDIKALSVAHFEEQLDWLQEHYTVTDYRTMLCFLRGEDTGDRPLAVLTFDDGVIDHYETVFPILHRRGLCGMFFVCDLAVADSPILLNVHAIHFLLARMGSDAFREAVTAWLAAEGIPVPETAGQDGVLYRYDASANGAIKKLLNYTLPYDVADRLLDALFREHLGDPVMFARSLYLTSSQIREMADGGMVFGGHTKSHRILSRLSKDEQQDQLAGAVPLIRSLTAQTDVPFAFPYGHPQTYTTDTLQILERNGYIGAFTTTRDSIRPADYPFLTLPRYDTKDLHPFAVLPHA